MIWLPPRVTRTDTLFPYSTLFRSWLKTKCIKRQEFVIVGWTPSDKSRSFRSLMLGVHEKGELRYAGKVGTGFDTQELFRLQALMKPLARKEATVKAPRSDVRRAHWIEPKLVAEIDYTEMTQSEERRVGKECVRTGRD